MSRVLQDIALWSNYQDANKLGLTGMISAIQEINNPPAWDQKIEILLNNLAELTAESESNKVNTILCYHIQSARISNNKESLRPFVINGCQ